ncbi:MAG TPA: hypothetical protein VJ817_13235 [Gemmatimonadales bacterium]|nr:hypothetical protein [Gemmatimonadales bacterium]
MRHTLAGLGILLMAAATPAPAQTVSFAGTWKLNANESDNPALKLQALLEKGPTVVSGMREGRGRPSTGAGRLDRPESGSSGAASASAAGAAVMRSGPYGRVMKPAAQILVVQTDSTIVISDDASLPQTLYLDGRKSEEPMPGAESMFTTAKWKDGKLTVERKLGGSGSIREVYTLDAAKRRLMVEAKLTSAELQGTLEVRRVYDAVN